MNNELLLTVLGGIGTIFAGIFALIKYITGQMTKVNNSFLDYLEKKNGLHERTSQMFNETAIRVNEDANKRAESVNQALNDNSKILSSILENQRRSNRKRK